MAKTGSKPKGKRSEIKDDDTLEGDEEEEGGVAVVDGDDEFEVPDVVGGDDDEEDADEDTDDEDEGEPADDEDEAEDDDEEDEAEPADEVKPKRGKATAKPAKAKATKPAKAKATSKKKAEPEPEPDEDDGEEAGGAMSSLNKNWTWASDFETCDVPLSQLKEPKGGRVPTDEAVEAMARNIKQVGLLNPITIGTDMAIVAGRTRFRAFKALKRDTIPARFAIDKDGNALKSSDAFAAIQMLSENIRRSDLTPLQKGKLYKQSIESGVASDVAGLAKMLGEGRGTVDKYIMLVDQGIKSLHEALDEDRITVDAATALLRRSKGDQKVQKAALQKLLDAADGKTVQSGDVDKKGVAAKTKRGKGTGSGRRPAKSDVSNDVMNTLESGSTMIVRKTETGSLLELKVEIAHDGAFNKFDFHRAVAEHIAKIDAKALRSELDVIRKRLDGDE